MGPIELVFVSSKKVECDGGKGSSRHPLVYLNMGKDNSIVCPYCSKNFTVKKSSGNVNFLKKFEKEVHK